MILGNTQRINCFGRMYNVPKNKGFHIVEGSKENIILYCYSNGKALQDAVEVYECPVTRHEKLLGYIGNPKEIKNHFML